MLSLGGSRLGPGWLGSEELVFSSWYLGGGKNLLGGIALGMGSLKSL